MSRGRGVLAGERTWAWAAAIAARRSFARFCHPDLLFDSSMDVQSEFAAGNWGRKQEKCEPHLSKESHTFFASRIVFRALVAIAIRYHTPLSGHAIFSVYEGHV